VTAAGRAWHRTAGEQVLAIFVAGEASVGCPVVARLRSEEAARAAFQAVLALVSMPGRAARTGSTGGLVCGALALSATELTHCRPASVEQPGYPPQCRCRFGVTFRLFI
jgi:hypothetical protein